MFRFWSFVIVAIAAISCNQVAAEGKLPLNIIHTLHS